jgi:hypothetical protein
VPTLEREVIEIASLALRNKERSGEIDALAALGRSTDVSRMPLFKWQGHNGWVKIPYLKEPLRTRLT